METRSVEQLLSHKRKNIITQEEDMGSMNMVVLMGNLTRDPELRRTPTGHAVVEMGMAVSEKYKNRAGEEVQNTCFVEIVVWDKQAEACGQYLAKGSAVTVEGKLQLDQWQTAAGEKRSKLKVRADRVQFIGRPRKEKMDNVKQELTEEEPVEVEAGFPF
jgi:single-strand DNA-binding protein